VYKRQHTHTHTWINWALLTLRPFGLPHTTQCLGFCNVALAPPLVHVLHAWNLAGALFVTVASVWGWCRSYVVPGLALWCSFRVLLGDILASSLQRPFAKDGDNNATTAAGPRKFPGVHRSGSRVPFSWRA